MGYKTGYSSLPSDISNNSIPYIGYTTSSSYNFPLGTTASGSGATYTFTIPVVGVWYVNASVTGTQGNTAGINKVSLSTTSGVIDASYCNGFIYNGNNSQSVTIQVSRVFLATSNSFSGYLVIYASGGYNSGVIISANVQMTKIG